jgi:serine phosphatase RsbU (regulator of sigma subunit)/CHASE2 domain-containing sensor protein
VPFALGLIIVFIVLRAFDPTPIEVMRLRVFDFFQQMQPRERPLAPVVIVDVDEESLAQFGQWPWPRNLVGELVRKVAEAGAPIIGFDVLFAEADRLSPDKFVENFPEMDDETRARLVALPSNDARLAESFSSAAVVLGMAALRPGEGGVPAPDFTRTPAREVGGDPRPHLHSFSRVIHSIDEIARAASGHGVISAIPEPDGVVRRVPLVVSLDGRLAPALSVEMLRIAVGQKLFTVDSSPAGVNGVGAGPLMVATAPDGRVWLHFTRHEPGRFVSAADVLTGAVPAKRLAKHLVLIGSTGLGITDFITTPVESNMPGVEVHAQLLEAFLKGGMLARPGFTFWIELGLLLFAAAVVIAVVPAMRPAFSPLAYVSTLLALLGGAWIAFAHFGLLLDASYPIVATGLVYSVMLTATRAAVEQARKRLARELAEERQAAARLEGELTAARDIQMGILPRDFAAFSERGDFTIHAYLEPARAVGGDLYDFDLVDDHYLFFAVGDVSGKGVPASLFMAITKALCKSNALRGAETIDAIINRANGEIARENPAMLFVTMLAGLLDLRSGELQLCNAGHDAPFLLRPGQAPELLEGDGGPPLCALDDFEYPLDRFQLAPGDRLVIVTDGVTEAQNRAQALYGTERLAQILGGLPESEDSEAIVSAVTEDIHRFEDGAEQFDDTTIMAIRYTGPSE